ncbi:MAG: DNA (cytosine-5-)-methyltransferase [Lentisphaerae bacterium GWF2_57_35]|nr:MAG: DNA (cytosine-5-)-methyltransferase [Lentisphaerae bacterium GWF2_57_35]
MQNVAIHLNTASSLIRQKTFAEFFAGIGLMRMGLEKVGWSLKFANDISQDKYKMYRTHFKDEPDHFVVEDIHKLRGDRIPSVALATASFPCTDLSLAGMRKGLSGKESSAFWGVIRILEEMKDRKPPVVLLENVVGFLTSHGGKDFQAAMLALNRLGYSVDALIVDAERFVPQSRVRLFVIGSILPGIKRSGIGDPTAFYESPVRPAALASFIHDHPEIAWNLRAVNTPPTRRNTLSDLLEELPEDSAFWWSAKRTQYLLSQLSEKHAKTLAEMTAKSAWTYGTVFRRIRNEKSMAELRVDGIAGCLRTPKGGSARQIVVKAGYGQTFARLLTPRECARLMGADDYAIEASLHHALFGFGDAVCVPVASWIAENYIDPLLDDLQKHCTSPDRSEWDVA